MRLLRHRGGVGVADVGVECGDDANGVGDCAAQVFPVGGDALHAAFGQGEAAVAQVAHTFEQAVGNDGLEGVELQLAGLGGEGDGDVVADDFEGDLVHHLGNHRVHLARHDAGARLHGRQVDFAQAGARAAGEQAQVVAGFGQLHGHAFEHARQLHEGAAVLRGFDQVGGGLQRDAGDLAQVPQHQRCVVGVGGDAGADGGGAHVDFTQQQHGFAQALFVFAQHHGVGAELLAQRHGHGVLQLGAAHLQHVLEFLGLGLEGLAQHGHGVDQPEDAEPGGDLQRRGVDVVGALADVDLLVRVQVLVFAFAVAQQLQRPVGDDLVGVHVGGGAGAALDHVHHKLLVQLAVQQLGAGGADGVAALLVQQAQLVVRQGGGLLDAGQRLDQLGVDGDGRAGDGEVLAGAQGVYAVVHVGGHFAVAQQVVFDAEKGGVHGFVSCVGLDGCQQRQDTARATISEQGGHADHASRLPGGDTGLPPPQPEPRRPRAVFKKLS